MTLSSTSRLLVLAQENSSPPAPAESSLTMDVLQTVSYFFASGGFFMALILLCSLVATAVTVWKLLELRRDNTLPSDLSDPLEAAAVSGDLHDLAARASASSTPLGRLSHQALSQEFADRTEAETAIEGHAREEVARMETGVAILEVVITVAPLLGLLGTVSGLIGVFSTLGEGQGTADPTGIALGIAEALHTTIAGLVVAVPTVIAHSYFSKRIEKLSLRLEILLGQILANRFRPAAEEGAASPGYGALAPE